MKKYADNELLSMLSCDNEHALKVIYERYFSLIFSFMLKECQFEDDAKDLTQEVFFKLWKVRYKLEITDSLKNYLYAIARNTFIDYVRKKVNQKVFETLNDELYISDQELADEDRDLLEELLSLADQMPEKRKEVFKLRWIDGLSRKDIAEQMNISVVTVDIHIRKAVDFLKEKAKSNKLMSILSLFV